MSDLPPTPHESDKEPVKPRDSDVAWKLVGAVLGAVGLVAGARTRGFPSELLDPFGPLLVAIVALIGANVGALIGSLIARFLQKRAAKSDLNNSEPGSTPLQESGDKAVKQGLRALVGLNAWITVGGMIGAFGGWAFLASPPSAPKSDPTMGMFNMIFGLAALLIALFKLVIFATAGSLIGVLVGSLIRIFRAKR